MGSHETIAVETGTAQFLETVSTRLEAARRGQPRLRTELLIAAQRDLARLAEIDDAVGGAAQLSALYVRCQLLLERVLNSRLWASPAALASQEGNMMRTTIVQLLQDCLK